MSDRPAARAAEQEPLPFSPFVPGCAVSGHVRAGAGGWLRRFGHHTVGRRGANVAQAGDLGL